MSKTELAPVPKRRSLSEGAEGADRRPVQPARNIHCWRGAVAWRERKLGAQMDSPG